MAYTLARYVEPSDNGDIPSPDCADEFKTYQTSAKWAGSGEHQRRKQRCPMGHLYDEVNSQGSRVCGECRRIKHRAAYAAKKAAASE